MISRMVGWAVLMLALLAPWPGWAVTVAQQGNQVVIDGRVTPVIFARGCTAPEALPAYQAMGFNTLLITLDSPGEVALERADALADAAERLGLYLLIELRNGSWASGQYADLANEKYRGSCTYFLDEVIPHFAARDRLLGGIIGTVEEGHLASEITTLARFLREKYGTVEAMNAALARTKPDGGMIRSNLPDFTVITEQNFAALAAQDPDIQAVVTADLTAFAEARAARDRAFQQYLRPRYGEVTGVNAQWNFKFARWDDVTIDVVHKRQQTRPNSSPLSLLELASFQAWVPRQLIAWWAEEIRARDARHLRLAGAQYTYRTLISLPPTLHGAYTECYPELAEPDRENHNPQAIDIARRGNRFIVLAGISAYRAEPTRVTNYLYEAALHGAAGVGLGDWAALTRMADGAGGVRQALDDLRRRDLLGRVPAPSTAIVYTPYALGPPIDRPRPLYGYMSGFPAEGPGQILFMLRAGTSYGQIDCLAAEDLTALPLRRYATIILPSALDIPPPAQRALADFVAGGGTVVADLGVGTLQATGNLSHLPEGMMPLFGVRALPAIERESYNLEVYREHHRFPLLLQGLRATGVAGGFMVRYSCKAEPIHPNVDLLFAFTKSRNIQLPKPRPFKPLTREPQSGMFVLRHGTGYALYATFPLYQFWRPGCMLYEEFSRGLFGAGSPIALERPIDFLPVSAEVAVFNDGAVTLWTRDGSLGVVRVRAARPTLYALARGQCEVAPDGVVLRAAHPGYHLAEPLPVTLDPVPYPVRVTTPQMDADGLVLLCDADEENGARPLSLWVASGRFPITPRATYRVNLLDADGDQQQLVTADESGRLHIAARHARCRVAITTGEPMLRLEPSPAARAYTVEEMLEITTPPRPKRQP